MVGMEINEELNGCIENMNTTTLNDIITIKKGKKPKTQSEHQQQGFMPYVDIAAFETGRIKMYTDGEKCLPCNNGDLLIVCDGSRSGLIGKAIKGYVGSTLARIDVDETVSKDYLYYFIQGKYSLLNTNVKGTGTPHVNQELLKSFEIPVPPLPEQERIVARIEELFSELDKAVETLKKTKEQLAVYRQAVLKEAFDSINNFDKDNVQSICDNIVDCPHSTPKWTQKGKICLRTSNFKRGYLDLTEINYVSEETYNIRNARLIPQPGDVLYSREGAILGIACIIPENLCVCLGQRMMLLRPNTRVVNKFLMYYLNSPRVTAYVASITGGSASPHVNVGDIKNFKLPVPPISEQIKLIEKLESRLSVCDSVEKTIDTALQEAEAMRQSILKKAFEGGFI